MTEWNHLSRLSQDICAQTLEEKQSQQPGLYQVQAPGYRWCEPPGTYAQMMSEPAHYYKVYPNSCNIEEDSNLRFSNLTDKRYIHQLFTRPYLGAYMGAGQSSIDNKDLESELIYGLDTRGYQRRACDVLSGASIDRFECLPEYGNPQRVEHVVFPGIWGGDNTRDYVRRIDAKRRCMNMANNKMINRVKK